MKKVSLIYLMLYLCVVSGGCASLNNMEKLASSKLEDILDTDPKYSYINKILGETSWHYVLDMLPDHRVQRDIFRYDNVRDFFMFPRVDGTILFMRILEVVEEGLMTQVFEFDNQAKYEEFFSKNTKKNAWRKHADRAPGSHYTMIHLTEMHKISCLVCLKGWCDTKDEAKKRSKVQEEHWTILASAQPLDHLDCCAKRADWCLPFYKIVRFCCIGITAQCCSVTSKEREEQDQIIK